MLDWGTVTPNDVLCPALWLIGSDNDNAMESYREYEEQIRGSDVRVHVMDGLNHVQEFENTGQVLPVIMEFIRS